MTSPPAHDPASNVADQAADWFSWRRSGAMTPDDLIAFDDWLERDPAHRAAFDRAGRAWQVSAGLSDHPTMLALREAARGRTAPRRWQLHVAGGTVAAGLAAAALFTGIGWPFAGGAQMARSTFTSAVGQRATVLLADGSKVTLDTDTVVVAQETASERRIDLVRGRAFFDVAKEHRRPFVVYAGQDSVTATGTAFDVRLEPAGLEVNLLRGSVTVERPGDTIAPARVARMAPGQRLVATTDRPWRMAGAGAAEGARWLRGQVTFRGAPLGTVVAELNRYSNRKIELADTGIAATPIVGVFDTGDLDGSVQLIADERLARVATRDRHRIVLTAPK